MGVINSARTRQQMLHAQTFHSDALGPQEDAAAAGDRRPAPDTWIYPLVQMKPFEIQIDEAVTATLLTEAECGARVYLTTGYFNLTQAYMDLVLGTRAEYQILLASPEVNGFFGAKGVAGAIPAAYVHIERQFYQEVCSLGQQERVRLQEYWRRDWTFHAKGTGPAQGASLPSACRSRTQTSCAPGTWSAGHGRHSLPGDGRAGEPPDPGAPTAPRPPRDSGWRGGTYLVLNSPFSVFPSPLHSGKIEAVPSQRPRGRCCVTVGPSLSL